MTSIKTLNAEDISSAQSKKLNVLRNKYNGNVSSINLATGEQIINSNPSSPLKDQNLKIQYHLNQLQQTQPNSRVKAGYPQVDQMKSLLFNNNNTEQNYIHKEIKHINLTIDSNNNISNQLQQQIISPNQSKSLILNISLQDSNNNINQSASNNPPSQIKILGRAQDAAQRMRSDPDLSHFGENKLKLDSKVSEQVPIQDGVDVPIKSDYLLNAKLTHSQIQLNAIHLQEKNNQEEKQFARGVPFSHSQRDNQMQLLSKSATPFYNAQISQENYQDSRKAEENRSSRSNEFQKVNGMKQQTQQSSQQSQKQISEEYHFQNNENSEEVAPGGGFYGDNSPNISNKPVQMPSVDMKVANQSQERKNTSKRRLQSPQNQKNIIKQKVGQTPVPCDSNRKDFKRQNLQQQQQTQQQTPFTATSKDHRIIALCESNNFTREWVHRFLGIRNISQYEVFSFPGGPGCLVMEDEEEKLIWQNALRSFLKNVSKVYQIQEVYIFQNTNSIFTQFSENQFKKSSCSMNEILKSACCYVKDLHSCSVKGYTINQKGIVDKIV